MDVLFRWPVIWEEGGLCTLISNILECEQKCVLSPWLVWLSGLSAGLRTKGSPVRFPVRAHAWVVGQVPTGGRVRGTYTLMFLSLSISHCSSLLKINNIFFKKENTYIAHMSAELPELYHCQKKNKTPQQPTLFQNLDFPTQNTVMFSSFTLF